MTADRADLSDLVARYAAAVDDHTDDAALAEKIGVQVSTVPGDEAALKITRPLDLAFAEAVLSRDRAGLAAG